ncbi:MAG: NlpC/P60 family protein [Bacteroidia bacterium]|nr:NlpC/P60 family protein [Bacteroidia bacterium]MDW8088590.1 NlpC/P60 family protein [Bacteroidia bacterium]
MRGALLIGAGALWVSCTARARLQRTELRVVEVAKSYLGTPYRYGGLDRRGLDCSGLVCRVYEEGAGMKLPRTADAQAKIGRPVARRGLQPGDLVFFKEPGSRKVTHVGIVSAVQGREVHFIHASSTRGVREDRLNDPHWQARWQGARRLLPPSKAHAQSGRRGK